MDQSHETVMAVTGEIEIPEPDYDDDDEDADTSEAVPDSTVLDDVATSSERSHGDEVAPICSETQPPPTSASPHLCDVAASADAADDDIESTSYKFGEVRAKLEAYSRDELHVLAASMARDDSNPEPEPDYSDTDDDLEPSDGAPSSPSKKSDGPGIPQSKEQRDLLRELLRNQKLGLNVLSKKSELEIEMEKRKMRQLRREEEENQRQKRSSFELRMEEQAKKVTLAEQQQQQQQLQDQQSSTSENDDQQPEFLRVHSKISKVKSAS